MVGLFAVFAGPETPAYGRGRSFHSWWTDPLGATVSSILPRATFCQGNNLLNGLESRMEGGGWDRGDFVASVFGPRPRPGLREIASLFMDRSSKCTCWKHTPRSHARLEQGPLPGAEVRQAREPAHHDRLYASK